eukprot:TRINITY_DN61796_c0_g1_i1.p1 TRINITY_DN61796_c0_g1~~TRINITY_DN61796_c0_g1_i1.p1  ORF type:complete len:499 (+),score=68.85 TRINITY_DN61796_c0_g1_i1:68-1498(+)
MAAVATSVVSGVCLPEFSDVRRLFEEQFADGTNCGAAVCVVIDGEVVVDLWGGQKDPEGLLGPWEKETVVNVFSATKAWTALCAHILAGRGLLDYDSPVCTVWPEFGVAGKDGITIRQLLCHSSGMQTLRVPIFDVRQTTDWNLITSLLAAQRPLWTPGSKARYHAFTFGHLVGEVVRRCDPHHRTVGNFFREEVLEPLGLQDECFLGCVPTEQCATCFSADQVETYRYSGSGGESSFETDILALLGLYDAGLADSATAEDQEAGHQAFQRVVCLNPQRHCAITNEPLWREAELPASGGHTNARAMAKLYGALVDGLPEKSQGGNSCSGGAARAGRVSSYSGGDIVDPAVLENATQNVWSRGVFGPGSSWGGGFTLQPLGEGRAPRSFGHNGLGGHITFGDPDRRLGFGFTLNRCVTTKGSRSPGNELVQKVYEALAARDGRVEGNLRPAETSPIPGTTGVDVINTAADASDRSCL